MTNILNKIAIIEIHLSNGPIFAGCHLFLDRIIRLVKLSLFILTTAGIICGPSIAIAQESTFGIGKFVPDDSKQPWNLEAEEVSYDQKTDQYVAAGNVVISKGKIKISADYIRFDRTNSQAYARGNVVLTSGQDLLSGSTMEIDLEQQVGKIENGYIFLKENNYHVRGDTIQKTGESTYTVDRATITTCDGESPDWKLTGEDIKINSDGPSTAKHVKFYAGKVPVLYSPYLYFPARKERQTGFLLPEPWYSNRLGFSYNQPFFWAISENTDATFYGQYMGFRGFKAGAEYRYILNEGSKGTFMLDGFHDDQVDDGLDGSSDKWGYDDGDNDALRTNRDRYWFRGSHYQDLPAGFNAKLDLDIVSDQDYLRDFRRGYMGYRESSKYFNKNFNRQLDDYNDPVRVNRLLINKQWTASTFNAEGRWYDNSITRGQGGTKDQLQQLPFIEFNAQKQSLAGSPLFYTFNSEYVNYWREEGSRTQRLDALPRFYLPYRHKEYFTVEPSLGLRGTYWNLYKSEPENEGVDENSFRGLVDARLDFASEINKLFNINWNAVDRIQHTILPQLSYQFIQDDGQDDLPNFDPKDRIEGQNLLSYSLINTLTSRSTKRKSKNAYRPRGQDRSSGTVDSPAMHDYRDFFRFKVEQNYDFDRSDRPFSPIFTELDFLPLQYVTLDTDARWSVYDHKFLAYNIAANFSDKRGDLLYIEYRKDEGSDRDDESQSKIENIYARLFLKMNDRLSFFFNHEYNLEDSTRVSTAVGTRYNSQCWGVSLRVEDRGPNDRTFEFKVNLIGLGEFGT